TEVSSLAHGAPYPFLESRARRFGGSTTRWSGACIPLDADDFLAKPWLPYSGWPFERSHLMPYYRRACGVLSIPTSLLVLPEDNFFQGSPLETKGVYFSHLLDLGQKYRRQIERSANITLITHATVSQLVPDAEGNQITQLDIASFFDHTFTIEPKTVILATGGIENARLLLASNSRQPRGIGNHYDQVGRYFMEHEYKVVGILPLGPHRRSTIFFTNTSSFRQTQVQGTLGLTDVWRRQHQLLNLHLRFHRYTLLEDSEAVITAKQWQVAGLGSKTSAQWQQLWQSNWTILPRYVIWHVWNKLDRAAFFDHVRLSGWIEQEPNPDNRITLSQTRDTLGQPLAHLTLHFSDRMQDSVERSLQHFSDILSNRGMGQLQFDSERLKHLAPYNKMGFHHMGTTRMHPNPHFGVVDANSKVHQVHNLFIAGSSVFPTGGAANPTFTIVALAMRLADHIRLLYR
ncbi:MAG: GMC oxidoreductase, partial [Thermosynechococcaceae cyanobacterium]